MKKDKKFDLMGFAWKLRLSLLAKGHNLHAKGNHADANKIYFLAESVWAEVTRDARTIKWTREIARGGCIVDGREFAEPKKNSQK